MIVASVPTMMPLRNLPAKKTGLAVAKYSRPTAMKEMAKAQKRVS